MYSSSAWYRTYYCDEQLFGAEQSDTLDVLFYGYAHCIAEGKEGKALLLSSKYLHVTNVIN